jgi:hypothetical protein
MRRAPPCRSAGQSTTEFLIVFPLLVLLVFGIIQFALLYQARATLNHATMLAARAGALHNGDRNRMRAALATGLAPLFAAAPSPAGYAQALRKANQETAAVSNMARVEVLNPTRSAFTDFGRARLDGIGGRELPSDTLNYRNPAPGGASGLSVQDANILHVRVNYCFRLIVPVLDRVIGTGASSTSCINPLVRGPRIIIQSEAMVRMQSNFYESNL